MTKAAVEAQSPHIFRVQIQRFSKFSLRQRFVSPDNMNQLLDKFIVCLRKKIYLHAYILP